MCLCLKSTHVSGYFSFIFLDIPQQGLQVFALCIQLYIHIQDLSKGSIDILFHCSRYKSKFEYETHDCSPDNFFTNETVPCDTYIYNRDVFANTLTTDINLVTFLLFSKLNLMVKEVNLLFQNFVLKDLQVDILKK
jgi:hypothetical protein